MIEFLDMDMDFFVDNIAHWNDNSNERLDSSYYFPMSELKVNDFIENKLGLSKKNKIKGKIITNHHEAFYFWRDLINQGLLAAPFNIVHIDAHADLGLGYPSYTSIFTEILSLPLEKRSDIENYPLSFAKPSIGDYLLFALACRWVSSLTYVVHPRGHGDDYVSFILEHNGKFEKRIRLSEFDSKTIDAIIQLPNVDKISMDSVIFGGGNLEEFYRKAKLEPMVPFKITQVYDHIKPKNGFDFLVFCTSPNYTPASADFIIDVIGEYIQPL